MLGQLTIPLIGAGGEPVDFLRTILSHGVADLPPFFVDPAAPSITVTLTLGRAARTVVIAPGHRGNATVTPRGPAPSAALQKLILHEVRHILRLDEDLSPFYIMALRDPALAWAAAGAGRMMRCQTAFEAAVKTICTTNCAWSRDARMVNALVEHLGRRAPGAPKSGAAGRAFPTPAAMAGADDTFYRDIARAGYRGAYLRQLAESVATGGTDLDALDPAAPAALPDDEVERRLLALPGVGPYAAAHIMMMLGAIAPRARLVDPPQVRAPRRAQVRPRRRHAPPLPPLRSLRRTRILAVPHA